MIISRRSFLGSTAATCLVGLGTPAMGQSTQALQIVMPIGGGTGGDTSTRMLADVMTHSLKRPIVIENRPGADTLIATQHVLSGPSDGSRTLFTSPSNMVLLPLLNKKLPYNPSTDLQPIITTSRGGAALAFKPGRFKSLDDLVKTAQQNPGKISIATYGGHYYKLLALMIERELGIQLNHAPYKDPAPALNDLVGGSVDLMVIDASGALEFYRGNKIDILAMTHETRPKSYPKVPTFKESGLPNLVAYIWIGFAVKAGTPPEMVQALYQSVADALQSKTYQDYVARMSAGSEIIAMPPDKTLHFLQTERQRFAKLIEQTGYTS